MQALEKLEKLFIRRLDLKYLVACWGGGISEADDLDTLDRQIADLESDLSRVEVDEAFANAKNQIRNVPYLSARQLGASDEEALRNWHNYLDGRHQDEPSLESCQICQGDDDWGFDCVGVEYEDC